MVLKKMFFIAVIIILINAIMISPIYAMGDVIGAGKNFLEAGHKVEEVINTTALQGTSNFIYNMFLTVAIVLAVGVGTVLGIKFITSSVEGQAKIKEAVIPYIVGCIVIFAAFPIWSFIVGSGQDATGIDPDKEGLDVTDDETSSKQNTSTTTTWKCPSCKENMEVPYGVITASKDYTCPHCSAPLTQENGKFVVDGFTCPSCSKYMNVPGAIIVGSKDYTCPHCTTLLKQENGKFVVK